MSLVSSAFARPSWSAYTASLVYKEILKGLVSTVSDEEIRMRTDKSNFEDEAIDPDGNQRTKNPNQSKVEINKSYGEAKRQLIQSMAV
jgi:hypothetical protein